MSKQVSLRIYVVHSRELEARRKNVERLADAFCKVCSVEKVVYCQKNRSDELARTSLKEVVNFSPIPADDTPAANVFNSLIQQLHVNQVSNALNHRNALQKIAEFETTQKKRLDSDPSDKDELAHLVIEDDCIVETQDGREDIKETLRKLVNSVRMTLSTWGLLFPCVSVVVPPHLEEKQDKDLARQQLADLTDTVTSIPPFIASTCNAYFVTPTFAKAMLSHMANIKFPWNVQLSHAVHMAMRDGNAAGHRVVGTRRVALLDGSKTGHFVSTLNGSNALSLCPEYVELVRLINNPVQSDDKKATLDKNVKEMLDKYREKSNVIKDHPDIQRLYAQHLVSSKKYAVAHAELQRACKVLLDTPLCPVGNTSSVMRDYLASFAYVQDVPSA